MILENFVLAGRDICQNDQRINIRSNQVAVDRGITIPTTGGTWYEIGVDDGLTDQPFRCSSVRGSKSSEADSPAPTPSMGSLGKGLPSSKSASSILILTNPCFSDLVSGTVRWDGIVGGLVVRMSSYTWYFGGVSGGNEQGRDMKVLVCGMRPEASLLSRLADA